MDDEQAFLICQRNGIRLTKGPRLTREVAEAMLRMEDAAKTAEDLHRALLRDADKRIKELERAPRWEPVGYESFGNGMHSLTAEPTGKIIIHQIGEHTWFNLPDDVRLCQKQEPA